MTPMSRMGKFNKNAGFSRASLENTGLVNCDTSSRASRMSRQGSQFAQIKAKKQTKKYMKDPELDSIPFNDKSFDKAIGKIEGRLEDHNE